MKSNQYYNISNFKEGDTIANDKNEQGLVVDRWPDDRSSGGTRVYWFKSKHMDEYIWDYCPKLKFKFIK